jgi:hypothetical protein
MCSHYIVYYEVFVAGFMCLYQAIELNFEHSITKWHAAYLRTVNKYREEGRPVIYEDKPFIHSSHTRPRNWTYDTPSGYMTPVSKGRRLTIVHAGGRTVFIPGALLMFKSHLKTGYYHKEMNTSEVANRKTYSEFASKFGSCYS